MAGWIRASELAAHCPCAELTLPTGCATLCTSLFSENLLVGQSVENAPNTHYLARFSVDFVIPTGNTPRF